MKLRTGYLTVAMNIAKYISSQAYAPFLLAVVLAPYWDPVWVGK